jgi:hypothetical protein
MYFTTFKNTILDDMLGSSATQMGATIELGLSSTTPNANGTNITEPSTGGYARISITNNDTNWPAASSGVKSNGVEYNWTPSGASWNGLTHWVIWDGGVAKLYGILDNGSGVPQTINVPDGDTYRILATRLRIQ